ncbi:MAG: HipA domain-containing protein, partial [Bdellovibrionales bacterium]
MIAYKIASLMSIDAPHTFLAVENDRVGVLSQWFYDYRGEFLHKPGGDIASMLIKNFDKLRGTQHNISLLLKVCTLLRRISKDMSFELLHDPKKYVVKMLVFDALIGNTDRHQDNWSILYDFAEKTVRFSPVFDNGSSLGFEMHENKEAFKCVPKALERYVLKGCHHIRKDDYSNRRFQHFELLRFLCTEDNKAKGYMIEALDIDLDEVERYLYSLQNFESVSKLSSERIVFIISLLRLRYDRIMSVLDGM